MLQKKIRGASEGALREPVHAFKKSFLGSGVFKIDVESPVTIEL